VAARLGIMRLLTTKVKPIDSSEVSHTSEVRGASKLNFSALPYLLLAKAPLTK